MSNVKAVIEFLSDDFDCFFQKDVKITIRHPYNTVMYKFSKQNSAIYENMSELKESGIYFLVYEKDCRVYVGQSILRSDGSGVVNRMREVDHDTSWDVGIAIISTLKIDNNTNLLAYSGNLRYLENYFYKELQKGMYDVRQTTPTLSPTDHEAEIADFIRGVKIGCRLLGYPLFGDYMPKINKSRGGVTTPPTQYEEPILNFTNNKYTAKAQWRTENINGQTNKRLWVLSGAKLKKDTGLIKYVLKHPTTKYYKEAYDKRNELNNNGGIINDILVCDAPFNSKSAASTFIMATSTKDTWV